jgi:uncharacterized cysteine cluster protein YcgN (CxxCxxCC family)
MTGKQKSDERPFWKTKSLDDMSIDEWESLCDGCGRCCLHKLEDIDTGQVDYTNIACRLLDLGTCRCSEYPTRHALVSDCLELTPEAVRENAWLPSSCAYRMISEGRDLAWWHPLVSGNPDTVHQAGVSVRDRVVTAHRAGHEEDHIVDWPLASVK